MNWAVKLYQDVTNKPQGIPGQWPAEIISLGESEELPSGPWQLMTDAEYEAHLATYLSAFITWKATYDAVQTLLEKRRSDIKKNRQYGIAVIEQIIFYIRGLPSPNATEVKEIFTTCGIFLLIGSLTFASDAILAVTGNSILDATYSEGMTVKTYISNLILAGNQGE